MKPTYSGFEAKKNSGFTELPPPGAYVAQIQGVKTEMGYDKVHEQIVLMIDITDGDYAGQYMKVFEDQKNSFGDSVKFKGVFRLTPPIEGDEAWRKSQFEGNLWCVEQSNPGYHWDWDETKLKGKKVGINVRKSIYIGNDGKEHETTEIGRLETVQDVKDDKVKPLKDRRPKNSGNSEESDNGYTNVKVEVPF